MLGAGSFGRVLLVEDRHNPQGDLLAMKIQPKAAIFKDGHVEHLRAEHDLLHALKTPFLVSMTDSFQVSGFVFVFGCVFGFIYATFIFRTQHTCTL